MKDNLEEVIYNAREMDDGDLTDAMLVEAIRVFQEVEGLKGDGMAGPKTQRAMLAALGDAPAETGVTFPAPGPYKNDAPYPKSYSDRERVFGKPGDKDSEWYETNIDYRQGDNALAGAPPRFYVKYHSGIESHVHEAFQRAKEASDYMLYRVGSFNYRPIRHGKGGRTTLSSHAFGIAFDINAPDNRVRRFAWASDVPERFSDAWRALWPKGVDEAFVNAFKSCGFRWGGDYQTFVDPMHFEWVGLKGWG